MLNGLVVYTLATRLQRVAEVKRTGAKLVPRGIRGGKEPRTDRVLFLAWRHLPLFGSNVVPVCDDKVSHSDEPDRRTPQ